MFLLVLNLFLLVVGMLMDIFSAIVVVVPLIVPIAAQFGINPYHLGIVFLLNLEIGYMTPPVGLNLFISSFRFNKPVTLIYRSVVPFVGLLLVALVITTYVPSLSTAMVGLMADPGEQTGAPLAPVQQPSGPTLDDLPGADAGAATLDDLGGGETLDDLDQGNSGETLDDLDQGNSGETLDDLDQGAHPGETLDDLDQGAHPGETLDDLP
jgi:hypothetical protein